MSTIKKRFFGVWLVAIALLMAVSACSNNGNKAESSPAAQTPASTGTSTAEASQAAPTPEAVQFPLAAPITVTFARTEHSAQGKLAFAPEGHPGFKWLEEQTNIKLDVTHIPVGNAKERMNLMLATNDLPDILLTNGSGWTLTDIEKAGKSGLLVNLLDEQYKHLIPNYLKLIESNLNLQSMISPDGELYSLYLVDPSGAPFTATLPYRKDLWDKHNLQPETWDELYEALKLLKQEYPDSYPFGAANQGTTVSILQYGPAGFRSGDSIYYNHDKNQWVYGPMEDNYKKFVEFFSKLYNEKILNPDFATMSYEQWQQSWINGETFFSYWWSATGNWFPGYPSSPNYGRDKEWVEAHRVPSMEKGGPRGWTTNTAPTNIYDIKVISAKSKHIEEILAMMDFLAVKENVTNLRYGPKGVEWDIVDGKYRWINPVIKSTYNPNGTKSALDHFKETYHVTQISGNQFEVLNDSAVGGEINDLASDLDNTQFEQEVKMYVDDGSTQLIPQPIVRLSEEDTEKQVQLKTALDTYANEIVIKIIGGQLPISELDNMKKTLEGMGVNDLIKLYADNSNK